MRIDIQNTGALMLLSSLQDASVDALVTDPPSGIGFMGKAWDSHSAYKPQTHKGKDALRFGAAMGLKSWEVGFVAFLTDIMSSARRVLKPGAHGLVWAIPRTSDLTGIALRLAGFEIRDTVHHLFGSGFPKSLDVGKAIDAHLGAEREVVGKHPNPNGQRGGVTMGDGCQPSPNLTAPASEQAQQWDGWGTALKPGQEVWWLVRKPIAGTVAKTVLEHGTGALNIDGCRIESETIVRSGSTSFGGENAHCLGGAKDAYVVSVNNKGRWPTNLVMTHSAACVEGGACAPDCPVHLVGAQSGVTRSVPSVRGGVGFGAMTSRARSGNFSPHNDSGTAARFYPTFRYQAKPARSEKEAGCGHLPAKGGAEAVGRVEGSKGTKSPRAGAGRTASAVHNFHPTVKPIALMRWLVRLVTPPGGLVLDPFVGSGTTALACVHERMGFVGSEMNADYAAIARARVAHADPASAIEQKKQADKQPVEPPRGQQALF